MAWVADTDAGAKYRPANDGGDYYGILRRTRGVPAVLSEAAFITNPPEEALLATPEVQPVEGEAIARAIVRLRHHRRPRLGLRRALPPHPARRPRRRRRRLRRPTSRLSPAVAPKASSICPWAEAVD